MKIGIIGYGFVGKALEAGLNNDTDIIKIDPKNSEKNKTTNVNKIEIATNL